jgi:hypothetical protein
LDNVNKEKSDVSQSKEDLNVINLNDNLRKGLDCINSFTPLTGAAVTATALVVGGFGLVSAALGVSFFANVSSTVLTKFC